MNFAKSTRPVLSPAAAVGLSVLYTLLYVIPFYVTPRTRPSPLLQRDAPSSIRARIRSVVFSSVLVCLITAYVCSSYGDLSGPEIARFTGWWPIAIDDVVKSSILVIILFAGPLFERGVADGWWRTWIQGTAVAEIFATPTGWRTFVVSPVSEELVWRSMIIPLHLLAGMSPTKVVFVTPLYFGIAHIHHCYEFKLTHPQTPMLPAILRSLFQFAYTSLFGFYAGFLFLRTGNLLAAIVTHSFCNWMGLPRFWGRIESEDASEHISWTVAYYSLLVAGAYGFYRNLFVLTESANSLVPNWPS